MAEQGDAENWIPRRCSPVELEDNIEFHTIWECDRYCREYAAANYTHFGIKVHKTMTCLTISCKNKDCQLLVSFSRRAGIRVWKIRKYHGHSHQCTEELKVNEISGRTASVYTTQQVL